MRVLIEGGRRVGKTHTGDLMCHKIKNRTAHRVHKYMVVSIERRWVVLAQESLALSGGGGGE